MLRIGRDAEAPALTRTALAPPEHGGPGGEQWDEFVREGRVGPYERQYMRRDASRSFMIAGARLGG